MAVLGTGLFLVVGFFAYRTTLIWMYNRYMSADSYYSHGFLIPVVSLYFIYQLKDSLVKIQPEGSLWGLALVFFALLLHLLGTMLYVFSISGFSIFFLATGVTLFLFGQKITRTIWFPLAYLIFMFPLPMAVVELFSFPMKVFATASGVSIIRMLGIPIYYEGFNIYIPAGHLLVGNPCSGLRSLIAFLAIGAIFAYLVPISNLKKWTLFLFSIPVALFSNILRISVLILISNYWGVEAAAPETLFHTGSGILVFIVGFLLIIMADKVLSW